MSYNIRPSSFGEIIGQSDVIERLRVSTNAYKNQPYAMPHVLIDGPPGLGKTTIASAMANELGVNLYTLNAANLRSVKNIMPYIMGMSLKSVLFIDEIHRLPKLVEEFLYPIMEDFVLNISVEDKIESIDIPQFTLIGATTSGGSLSQPFYDRFQVKEHLSFYSDEDLAKLARLNSEKLGIVINDSDLLEIAKRSKGTPRILNGRLQWYKNYKMSYSEGDVGKIFDAQGIDNHGLDTYDRLYLKILKDNKGTALGIKAISSMSGIAIDTIENSIEPYLVRKGFVVRTPKGRVIGSAL
jgi:Holliday junction DNA helicase RuvB